MKTKIKKTQWLSLAILVGFIFSSFTIKEVEAPENLEIHGKSELEKVTEYTNQMIRTPIRQKLEKRITQKSFSRCWSGYTSEFKSEETVKTDDFAYGTITYTDACSPPEYICDFKVCPSKGYAAVRSKGSDEYISVDEWLKIKQWENSEHKNVFSSKKNG